MFDLLRGRIFRGKSVRFTGKKLNLLPTQVKKHALSIHYTDKLTSYMNHP